MPRTPALLSQGTEIKSFLHLPRRRWQAEETHCDKQRRLTGDRQRGKCIRLSSCVLCPAGMLDLNAAKSIWWDIVRMSTATEFSAHSLKQDQWWGQLGHLFKQFHKNTNPYHSLAHSLQDNVWQIEDKHVCTEELWSSNVLMLTSVTITFPKPMVSFFNCCACFCASRIFFCACQIVKASLGGCFAPICGRNYTGHLRCHTARYCMFNILSLIMSSRGWCQRQQ